MNDDNTRLGDFKETPEEKAAKSYLDWDDARLGQFVKATSLYILEKRIDGWDRVVGMASFLLIIGLLQEAQVGSFETTLKDVITGHDPNKTNWKITVEKLYE